MLAVCFDAGGKEEDEPFVVVAGFAGMANVCQNVGPAHDEVGVRPAWPSTWSAAGNRRPKPGGPSLLIVETMVSVDFFTVPTIRFQVLYAFLVLAHE